MHDYKKLDVWVKAMNFAKSIYELTEKFPSEEKFGLTSQIRKCAVSVPSNLAEGAGRSTNKDFAHFLSVAMGSVFELETQLLLARNLNLTGNLNMNDYLVELESISKMIHSLRKNILRV